MTAHKNLKFLFLMEIFSGLSRGSYLVCIGWTTLIVSNDVARVGQVFIIAMLTNIFAGPLVGIIVDRYNRKHLTIIAHLLLSVPMMTLGLALAIWPDLSTGWIFLTVCLASIFRLLYQVAHDGLIHANVQKNDLVHTVARFKISHLIGTAIGTLAAGLIIEQFAPTAGFLFSAAMSVFLIVPVAFVAGAKLKASAAGFGGFITDLKGGLEIFLRNRNVRMIALFSAVAQPVGQLSNAILSSYMRDDLGTGSDAFGFVDAAWPVGGMFAAILLSLGLRKMSGKYVEYGFGIMGGIATIILSMTSSIIALAVVHAVMGFSVWLCYILVDGRILQACRAENVGRTKVYVHIMYSLSALIMCLSPTLVKLPSTSGYFLYWGGFIVIGTLLLLGWKVWGGTRMRSAG